MKSIQWTQYSFLTTQVYLLLHNYGMQLNEIVYIVMLLCIEYREYRGQVLTSDNLQELISGLRNNDLLHYSHLLTGKSS